MKRNLVYGSRSLLSVVFFLGILVLIILIAERHPVRLDLTKEKTHSLSQKSIKILETIDQPVNAIGFFGDDEARSKAQDLFETYRYHNRKITYEFIDPDRKPEIAKKYDIKTYGTVVVEGYGKKETITTLSEESFTNALFKLSRKEAKKIYFLVGHGEHSVEDFDKEGYSNLKSSLEKANYSVAELNLMVSKDVPEDASVVLIAGPKKDLLPEEIDSLEKYIKRSGKLIVMIDPGYKGNLVKFLKPYGFELKDDVVIDKLSRIFGGSYLMPVVTSYGFHPITKDFRVATFFPEARSVGKPSDLPGNVAWIPFAMTSENAWAETDLKLLDKGEAKFEEGKDIPGPVVIGAISEISHSSEKKAFIVVFGDSDFASNTYFQLSGNSDLLLNAINYLAEEETLITIEPKSKGEETLVLTRNQMMLILLSSLIVTPLIVLAIASYVYMVRRAQR